MAAPSSPAATGPAALYADVAAAPGVPAPLGPSLASFPPPPASRPGWFGGNGKAGAAPPPTGTVNFAVWSGSAEAVSLVLLDPATRQPAAEFPLARCDSADGVWAVSLSNLPLAGVGYAFRASGPATPSTRWGGGPASGLFLDPRAPLVDCGRPTFGARSPTEGFVPGVGTPFVGSFDFVSPPFDWGKGDGKPALKPEDLVIYEVGVRPFTAGGGWESSTSSSPARGSALTGTYAGLAARAPYLAALGVTAVELLPIFEYDELEFRRFPNPRDHMTNVWGYSHISFFAPMARFGGQGREDGSAETGSVGFGGASASAAAELKAAIKVLHEHGIAVILDVVYNHTAESDDATPYPLSFRGLDAGGYYMLDPGANPPLLNFSGCGNTVAANEPAVQALILDSLRHWVTEFRVDGFRFDLASALTRDRWGRPLDDPPLIRAAAEDPVVGATLLIAEPWDCGGLYQVGSFPHHGEWAEWNGRFRDDVRRFIRGDPGAKRGFAARLAGSADLYGADGPGVPGLPAPRAAPRPAWHSINFVTAHDGFSLGDLVSYAHKHNEANGEGGRDGSDDNLSWNCGAEGPSGDAGVLALRSRVARNHILALFLSAGTPMIVSGDECLSTHAGNNNWYGHDTPLAWFDWAASKAEPGASFARFVSGLAALRRAHPLLGTPHRWTADDVTWHEDHWDNDESRFLAFELHPRDGGAGERLFAAFNAHGYGVPVPLPPGRKWARVVDTNLPPPRDFTPGGNAGVDPPTYMMEAHSAILLVSRE